MTHLYQKVTGEVLTCAMVSLFVIESLIALGALGCLASADRRKHMTTDSLFVLLLALFVFVPLVALFFLHRWKKILDLLYQPSRCLERRESCIMRAYL